MFSGLIDFYQKYVASPLEDEPPKPKKKRTKGRIPINSVFATRPLWHEDPEYLASLDKMMPELRPYQKEGVLQIERQGGRALLADEQGLGKAQPLDAKVLTPDGWVLMGKISIGSQVIGMDGKAVTVVGVYPQGIKKVYKITMKDGASANSCDDHLWAVWSPASKWNGYVPKALPLSEIRKDLTTPAGYSKFHIPVVKSVEFTERKIPLDPYLLGSILGDGSISGSGIRITSGDPELIDSIERLLPSGMCLGAQKTQGGATTYSIRNVGDNWRENYIVKTLKDLGLMGARSENKFIPEIYLYNTKETRIAMLQGLMDTDGYASKEGVVQYTSSSQILAKNVGEIVQSLGGTCRTSSRLKTYSYKGVKKVGQLAYTITICMPPGICPFRLKRKVERYKERKKYKPSRIISTVEYVGEKECQCIKVEAANGLYVTNDYIVTHNTPQVLRWAKNFLDPSEGPVLVVVPDTLKVNWEREVLKFNGWRSVHLESRTPPVHNGKASAPLYLINYNVIQDHVDYILNAIKPALFIMDECQNIKNPQAARTKASKRIAHRSPYVIGVSGTPLTNRPAELWPILNMIRPDKYKSFLSFGQRYCKPSFIRGRMVYNGADNLDELNWELRNGIMIRRLKKDVLQDLPAQQDFLIPLEIEHRNEYRAAERDFLVWLSKHSLAKARKAANAEMLVRTGYLKRLAAVLKIKSVIAWIHNFLETHDTKLIVFGIHKMVLGPLKEAFRDCSVLVNGETRKEDKQKFTDRFNRDPRCRVFFGNIESTGAGWSCDVASDVAFVELDWRPALHSQASARVHGIGRGIQGQISNSHYLIAHDTIEEKLVRVLNKKQRNINATLDGDPEMQLSNILEQLLDLMENEK